MAGTLKSSRTGFTLPELMVGLVVGMLLWVILLVLRGSQQRLTSRIDAHLDAETDQARLLRFLTHDLRAIPRLRDTELVHVDGEDAASPPERPGLRLLAQEGPARAGGGSYRRTLREVRYRFDPATRRLTRRVGGRSTELTLDRVEALSFRVRTTAQPGSRDSVVVSGQVRAGPGATPRSFSLALPFGPVKNAAVRWVSLLR